MDEINIKLPKTQETKKRKYGHLYFLFMCLFLDCVYYFPSLYVSLCRASKDHNTGTLPLSLWTIVLSSFRIFSPCGRKNEKTYKVNPTYQRSLQRLLVHGWVVYHLIHFFHGSSYSILFPSCYEDMQNCSVESCDKSLPCCAYELTNLYRRRWMVTPGIIDPNSV